MMTKTMKKLVSKVVRTPRGTRIDLGPLYLYDNGFITLYTKDGKAKIIAADDLQFSSRFLLVLRAMKQEAAKVAAEA